MIPIIISEVAIHFSATEDPWYRNRVLAMNETLARFLQNNDLTNHMLLGDDEEVGEDFEIFSTDLNERGYELMKLALDKWMAAIDRGGDPTSTRILEKYLRKLNSGS